jgi:spermidine/putrescine transport system ATP-binding protein
MKAYVDPAADQAIGDDPVWIGWDVDNMAVLND